MPGILSVEKTSNKDKIPNAADLHTKIFRKVP